MQFDGHNCPQSVLKWTPYLQYCFNCTGHVHSKLIGNPLPRLGFRDGLSTTLITTPASRGEFEQLVRASSDSDFSSFLLA